MIRRKEPHAYAMAELVDRWRWTIEGTDASRAGASAAGIGFTSVPTVCDVRITGPAGPIVLCVRLLGGQVPQDLAAITPRIAEGLGVAAARVRPYRPGYVLVSLLLADPLTEVLPLEHGRGVLIGRTEDGEDVRVDPVDMPHLLLQGQTRGGKSSWLYAAMAQLVRHPDLEVAGIDPSGLTLRPFTGTRHAARQVVGLADLDRVETVLAGLVADMDARLAAMPADRDVLPTGPVWPLRVVVFEEYAGLLRAADGLDAKFGKRIRALVGRLLAESHKVGFRVVIATQRAEATLIGGAERAQCGGRLTFRVDGTDTIKLLHTDADEFVADHTTAPAGIALLTWPGRPLTRIRAPYIGGYATFAAAIARHGEAAA